MALKDWIYNHAPTTIQNWIDGRREDAEIRGFLTDLERKQAIEKAYLPHDQTEAVDNILGVPLADRSIIEEIIQGDDRDYAAETGKTDWDAISEEIEAEDYVDQDRETEKWLLSAAERAERGIERSADDLERDDADENVRNHFAQQAARGISPAETHKEMWDDYEAWVANQEPIKHVKNGGLVKDKSDGTEYNYSIGKSDVGFHYSINEWPLVGHDREGEYSIKAYSTLEEAERAAQDNMPDLRDYAAECQEAIARTWERDQDEIELDEDEYDRAGRDDDEEEELGF